MLRSEAIIVCGEVQNILAALRQSSLHLDEIDLLQGSDGDADFSGNQRSKRAQANASKTRKPKNALTDSKTKTTLERKDAKPAGKENNDSGGKRGHSSSISRSVNGTLESKHAGSVRPGLGSYAGQTNSSSQSASESSKLDLIVQKFDHLRDQLHLQTFSPSNKNKNTQIVKPKDLFSPFLEAIRASAVGASATSLALTAVHKMLAHRILTSLSAPVDNGLDKEEKDEFPKETVEVFFDVVDSVIHCHFEQTDTGADEIAIMWILEVLKESVSCEYGRVLTNQKMWEIVSTLYQISVGKSNADMLRGLATRILGSLLERLFHRLFLDERQEEQHSYSYGLPVAIKIFEFLCSRIDPNHEAWHDMEARLNCFELIMVILQSTINIEKGTVELVRSKPLMDLIEDNLFRALIQTCQSAGRGFPLTESASGSSRPSTPTKFDNEFRVIAATAAMQNGSPVGILNRTPLTILTAALRVTSLLISHHNTRSCLKIQIEAFFNSVFLRVLEGKSGSTAEARMVLETLAGLMADTTMITDLYVNFDCDLKSTDVFANLFEHLSRYTFPMRMRVPALNNLQLLSLRCILYGVKAMASRCESAPSSDGFVSGYHRTPKELLKLRAAKRALKFCASQFNKKPKYGIEALQNAGILEDKPDPAIIATFLRDTRGLDKAAIGQFLGGDSPLNSEVLREFVTTFKMKGQTLLEALRMFLESFRLPGEAQQIDRILQCFAEMAYSECEEASSMPSCDCTYLFSFSIIMLNTDLHNPNIRPEKKMSLESFIKLNTNYGEEASSGQDLPSDFLKSVYFGIKDREINTMMEVG